LYASKTGYSKKYARWIADELDCRIARADMFDTDYLMYYETVIFGGGVYALHINGLKAITKNKGWLRGKHVHIFACGATPPRQEDMDKIFRANFTHEEQKRVRFYYFRGGFCYEKLPATDKALMSLLKMRLKYKKSLSEDEAGMLNAFEKPADFTDKRNIAPLIQAVEKEIKNTLHSPMAIK